MKEDETTLARISKLRLDEVKDKAYRSGRTVRVILDALVDKYLNKI